MFRKLSGTFLSIPARYAFSVFIIILIGTGLLMLPRSTVAGISWVDSLFISTSAVCVTGLTSVDVEERAAKRKEKEARKEERRRKRGLFP